MADHRKPPAKKRFGQNFLIDLSFIDRIVSALKIESGDNVIEIGPGRGAITQRLLDSGANVAAIEIDRDLHTVLEKQFHSDRRFELIKGDVLDTDLENIFAKETIKAVGNLPYNISTPILSRLIASRGHFSKLVLMFQREVVDRLVAEPGTSDRGYMTVIAQSSFEIEKLFDLPPAAFFPAPKVWSSVVSVLPKPANIGDTVEFKTLVSNGFAQKRKTLANNLKGNYGGVELERLGDRIDLSRRAETLTLAEWATACEILSTPL